MDFNLQAYQADHLLHLSAKPERRLSILENARHRWLEMDGVVQSAMSLSQPEHLCLPHQQSIAERLPAQASRILELGLREIEASSPSEFSGASEVLEFLAGLPSPEETLALRPSPSFQARVSELLEKNRAGGLTPEEEEEWRRYAYLEHLVRLAKAKAEGAEAVIVSAAIESELVGMDADDRMVFLEEMGLHETGLARVIRSGYELLHLITFFTVGPKEARAWTVHKGAKAPDAAGEIHSDMQRGFIRAETMAFADFVGLGGETACKDAGKLRQEGKEYVVQDGDVMHFKFNV